MDLERAKSLGDSEAALDISKSMIADKVDMRMSAFVVATQCYTDYMVVDGKAEEAFRFITDTMPETLDYERVPESFESLMAQVSSVLLLSQFDSTEAMKSAWSQLVLNWDAKGFPWRNGNSRAVTYDRLIAEDLEGAIKIYLEDYLSQPLARDIHLRDRSDAWLMSPIYDDPRVAARLAELDLEHQSMRRDVQRMLLQPEWN